MLEKEIDYALGLVRDELLRANKIHRAVINSPHEGYAILKEEVEEMWDEIKCDNTELSVQECVQVGAMAVKYIVNFR